MEYEVYELDDGIIKHLSKDGRLSFTESSIRLQVTEKTIRLRYKNLLDKGFLKVVDIVIRRFGVFLAEALKMDESHIRLSITAQYLPNIKREVKANYF